MQSIVEHVRSITELRDDEVSVYTSSYTSNGLTEIRVSSVRPMPAREGGTAVAINATIASSESEVAAAEAEWLRGVLLERRRTA